MSKSGAATGEGELQPMEQSVWQARWLLMPIFAFYGGMMLVGVFVS